MDHWRYFSLFDVLRYDNYFYDSTYSTNGYRYYPRNKVSPYTVYSYMVAGVQIKLSSFIPVNEKFSIFMSGAFSLKQKVYRSQETNNDPSGVLDAIDTNFSYTDFTFNLGLRWRFTTKKGPSPK